MNEHSTTNAKKDAFSALRKPEALKGNNNVSNIKKESIRKIAEQSGFTQREKREKKDIYTHQIGVRCRVGMSRIVNGISYKMNLKKQEIFELAILSLLKDHGLTDLINEYNKMIEKDIE